MSVGLVRDLLAATQLRSWAAAPTGLGRESRTEPKFSPMPEVSVAAGGRIFKALGHIAHRANQNVWLNKLLCINAYNGTILWQRDLDEGFMIHRNGMIATDDALYLAGDESCRRIDAQTGQVKDEIVIPAGIADGPVWKWMALEDGVLYALIGGQENKITTQRSDNPALGHWPWGMWQGHDYRDPKTSFGFGRTLVAVDSQSKKILWSHREEQHLDSRGVCMAGDRIYFYSPEKFLGCLDAKTGKVAWKTSDAKLLEAIGPNGRAQHYVTGYATTTYIKCNDRMIFFAGPQRNRLVVASAEDGKLLWQKGHGNLQLVLREDGVYAAGPGTTGSVMAYDSGEQLSQLPVRRACTRATGSIDSVFYRTPGGTVRIDVASKTAKHIAPMRPPCQDGVIVSNGMLYWGPWMCGCQLSFYGHICLAPAGKFNFRPDVDSSRLETGPDDPATVKEFAVQAGDWPCSRGNNRRTAVSRVAVPKRVKQQWAFQAPSAGRLTGPAVAGGVVFVGDESGMVRAVGADGTVRWKAATGGAIYGPPAVADGRVFAGSADGRVYALEAATGRLLWRFRLAPAERWISVYGKLISTWPVAGGVVVDRGVVYAAAGIAHYDGTYVVALAASSGKVKWYNDASGTLSEKVDSGISLQGDLYLADGELRFLGGGVYQTARYDLATGKCLNPPQQGVNASFRTAFYPYYPKYGKFASLHHPLPDGKVLAYQATYDGSGHVDLALLAGPPTGAKPQRNALWTDRFGRKFHSFIVTPDVLLAAGQTGYPKPTGCFLAAVNIRDGSDLWSVKLPAAAVRDGTALDHQGRIVVCLENGQMLCFAAAETSLPQAAR